MRIKWAGHQDECHQWCFQLVVRSQLEVLVQVCTAAEPVKRETLSVNKGLYDQIHISNKFRALQDYDKRCHKWNNLLHSYRISMATWFENLLTANFFNGQQQLGKP